VFVDDVIMSADKQHKARMLWVSGVLHAFTHLYGVALMPLYLLMQKDFKLESVEKATLLVTIMMATYYLPSYPMGILADRWNRKKLLGWGLAVNALGFVGLALSPNYAWAVASVAVAGFGGSFYHPAATAMVARLYPVGTGRALGLVAIGASAGFFVGPLYTGWRAGMLEHALGAAAWRRPVLELGLIGLVATLAFVWLADNERPLEKPRETRAQPDKLFPTGALWFFFLLCAFLLSLRDFAGASMGSLGSLFLQKARGYDPSRTGIALSVLFLASVISNPLFGKFSDRGRSRWTMFVLMVAAVVVISVPHTPAGWIVPIFIVYGFFFLSSYPMTEAAVMESVPDSVRGRVFGVFITVGGLIGNLSHWIVGAQVKKLGEAAYRPGGYYVLYGALGGLILISLAGLPCMRALRKREEEREPLGGYKVKTLER
jgi:MFS family permease